MSWFDLSLGPLFLVVAILVGVPFLIIIGLHSPAIALVVVATTGLLFLR